MKISKYITMSVLLAASATTFSSCSEDSLGPSIFDDKASELDESASTYKFDKWLKTNFLDAYNVQFNYKYKDVSTNMNYNLAPVEYQKAVDFALLSKYLWFDAYKEVAGDELLRAHAPRIISLIGSAAYNPLTGEPVTATTEGGIKITFYKTNLLNVNNFDQMNDDYFSTMHNKFVRLLFQSRSYPTSFALISATKYEPANWNSTDPSEGASAGFVSKLARSGSSEDFAEVVAKYLTLSDEKWDYIMDRAARGWVSWKDPKDASGDPQYFCFYYYNNNKQTEENKLYPSESQVLTRFRTEGDSSTIYYTLRNQYQTGIQPVKLDSTGTRRDAEGNPVDRNNFVLDGQGNRIPIVVYAVADDDGIDGVKAINQKLEIARRWMKEIWNVDLDKLRQEVRNRQQALNIEELRKQIEQ